MTVSRLSHPAHWPGRSNRHQSHAAFQNTGVFVVWGPGCACCHNEPAWSSAGNNGIRPCVAALYEHGPKPRNRAAPVRPCQTNHLGDARLSCCTPQWRTQNGLGSAFSCIACRCATDGAAGRALLRAAQTTAKVAVEKKALRAKRGGGTAGAEQSPGYMAIVREPSQTISWPTAPPQPGGRRWGGPDFVVMGRNLNNGAIDVTDQVKHRPRCQNQNYQTM
jgi:hypothetical protein